MSEIEKLGMFSLAGIISGEKYNILKQFHKIKERSKDIKYIKDSYYPDKDYLDKLKGKIVFDKNEILKQTKFSIDDLKKEIEKNNIYYIEDEAEKEQKQNNNNINDINNNINNKKIFLIKNYLKESKKEGKINKNKKQLFKSKKYKYHNAHMNKINKYKQEGLYKKILTQQQERTIYNPKMDYIYKKIKSGPKWEKLSGRDYLFLNKNNKISSSSYNNDKSRNIFPRLKKLSSVNNNTRKMQNIKTMNFTTINCKQKSSQTQSIKRATVIINKIFSDIKNNLNDTLSENNNDNTEINNNNNNINKNIPKKREYLPGPDFNRYLDLEKLSRKKKRLQKVTLSKIDLIPDYTSIEGNIKSFVNYNKSLNIVPLKRKIKYFEGINSTELFYDASKTFEKIYGNKMKSVPKFYKMISRPNDINNLPTFMKGLCSRLGLELNTEKALKMNNYENSKMYRSKSFFGKIKNYKNIKIRKVCYESDIDRDKNKINNDLNLIKRKFDGIKTISYD